MTHIDGEEAKGAVELGHLDDVREQEDEAAHAEELHKQHLVRVCKTHNHLEVKRVRAVRAVRRAVLCVR